MRSSPAICSRSSLSLIWTIPREKPRTPLAAEWSLLDTRRSACACTRATRTKVPYREWQTEVGFIDGWHSDGLVLLGSMGFLDHFTVTASRFAQAIAIEERETFDDRFGVVLA